MAVLWNPTVRKSVPIVIPQLPADFVSAVFSFGVCPNTNDPKLVQVIVKSNILTMKWEAKVFTLSSQIWKTVTIPSTLFNNRDLGFGYVCTQGFIYYLACNTGIKSNLIVSFDLSSEEFGQVYLPDSLLHSRYLELSKRNECLTLLESYEDVDDIHVWMMNDSVTKSLTKMFTLKSLGLPGSSKVLGFRKNGKAIIRTASVVVDDGTKLSSLVEVYDPCSGGIKDIGIIGIYGYFHVSSYMETLLLFDQADSVIYR